MSPLCHLPLWRKNYLLLDEYLGLLNLPIEDTPARPLGELGKSAAQRLTLILFIGSIKKIDLIHWQYQKDV